MASEWEKQILAYCMRVSRGLVRKGTIKMSVFSDGDAQELGGITAIQFIDIISYITRLHTNLKDPIRRRGFKCTIEVGHKVHELIHELGYRLELLNKDFQITEHEGYGNEIKLCFTYEPSLAPAMVFEDIEILDSSKESTMNETLNNDDTNFMNMMQQRFIEEFDFIDDDIAKNVTEREEKDMVHNFKKTDSKA
jgi:hypothetical protein